MLSQISLNAYVRQDILGHYFNVDVATRLSAREKSPGSLNGHTASAFPVEESVPQGSVIGPLPWNVDFNDILRLMTQVQASVDDSTLSFTLTAMTVGTRH